MVIELGIHSHTISNINFITSDNDSAAIHPNNSFALIDENRLNVSSLHINHYAIQSLDFFKRCKMTRGSAATIVNANVRNLGYFKSFDDTSNDIYDYELANKIYSPVHILNN
jgi:hypothetical protein